MSCAKQVQGSHRMPFHELDRHAVAGTARSVHLWLPPGQVWLPPIRTAQVNSVVAVDFPHCPIDTSFKGPDAGGAVVVELPSHVKGSPIQVGGPWI